MKLSDACQIHLEKVSELVDMYSKNEPFFLSKLKEWLAKTEEYLQIEKRPELSRIASLRGSIISAERGIFEPDFAIPAKTPKRKAGAAIGMMCLNKAQDVLNEILLPVKQAEAEAKDTISQVILVSDQNGILHEFWKDKALNSQNIIAYWQGLTQINEIRVGLDKALSLVGKEKAFLFMLDSIQKILK